MKPNLLFLFFTLCSWSSWAQESNVEKPKPFLFADIAFAGSTSGQQGNVFSAAASLNRWHYIALKKRFFVGYGLRFSVYSSHHQEFVTAPATISEGNFFKKQNNAKLDTLHLAVAQINSLNALIHLGYQFSEKITVGFNIDAIGFSFGKKRGGVFKAYSQNRQPSDEAAKVTPFNLLLTGDYDLGSLNSEIYLMWKFHKRIALRGGLSFLFSEYTTDRKLTFDNDRFRNKSLSPMLAIAFKL